MPKENRDRDNSFEQQRELLRRGYAGAQSVRERFPSLESLSIDMLFIDPAGLEKYSPQKRVFSAGAKAFFAFPCPRTLCLHGGFDLDPIIRTLHGGDGATLSGILQCNGTVQPLREQAARCLLRLEYTIQVQYEKSRSSNSVRYKSA